MAGNALTGYAELEVCWRRRLAVRHAVYLRAHTVILAGSIQVQDSNSSLLPVSGDITNRLLVTF